MKQPILELLCVGPRINRLTKYRKEGHVAADDKNVGAGPL